MKSSGLANSMLGKLILNTLFSIASQGIAPKKKSLYGAQTAQ
jgi:hypothetical protein